MIIDLTRKTTHDKPKPVNHKPKKILLKPSQTIQVPEWVRVGGSEYDIR